MNWAWRQPLPPTPKLVLLALADAADDAGVCWPGVATVAAKVGCSPRTVRRVMKRLVARTLLVAEPRYRADGACSSNRYRLLLEGGDRLSPAPGTADTAPARRGQGPPDATVIPGTTRGTERESPRPPGAAPKGRSGRGGSAPLYFPKDLLPEERERAAALVAVLDDPLDQQVLDEWVGILAAGAIRFSPLGCQRALVERARQGRFTPERAPRIAQARRARQQAEARQAGNPLPLPAPQNENDPLVRRMRAIEQRARGKRTV
ncbi:MAG TPA: hypothetical protein ENJ79_04335 [Gammaproteobacteria bacterium]|nr:hypothetical protein [Gammaproteobacteria bacterium]